MLLPTPLEVLHLVFAKPPILLLPIAIRHLRVFRSAASTENPLVPLIWLIIIFYRRCRFRVAL